MRRTARRLLFALLTSIALGALGLAGAGLFHPDDAALVEAELWWRVFGILAYIGIIGFWLTVFIGAFFALYALVRWIVAYGRRR